MLNAYITLHETQIYKQNGKSHFSLSSYSVMTPNNRNSQNLTHQIALLSLQKNLA